MGLERTPSGGLTHRLRNYLLAGIVVSAPITITLFIVWQILGYVDRTVTPFIPAAYNPASYLPFGLPGIGHLELAFSPKVQQLVADQLRRLPG